MLLFILNHSEVILLSDYNLFTRSEIVFSQAESVLSSAKIWIDEESMKKKGRQIEVYQDVNHADA